MKASINGPNRRKNRAGDRTVASDFEYDKSSSAAPDGTSELSIEKLETQLNTLKTMFAEKQKLVADLEAYGPGGKIVHLVEPEPETEVQKDPDINGNDPEENNAPAPAE